MLKWLKHNWKRSLLLLTAGYALHLFVEAFIVSNLLALVGVTIPILV
jgi:hypothetical protein